jgi:hypothetical protein
MKKITVTCDDDVIHDLLPAAVNTNQTPTAMDTLRRRIPFKLDDEEEIDADAVLDEQRVFIYMRTISI